jgi:GAF domain-containing protein
VESKRLASTIKTTTRLQGREAGAAEEEAGGAEELRRALEELAEARQQQAATAEVLNVISDSPTDVQPAFDTIAKLAVRLCGADLSLVTRFDGELIQLVAYDGVAGEGEEAVRRAFPQRPDYETATARAFRNCAVEHIPDVLADPKYLTKDTAHATGFRGVLGVPMVREGQVIGVIFVGRRTPGYFTDAKVELLKTFADQAVIAIENVRLFQEVNARTEALQRSVEEMRALGEVGRAVSSTLDMETVLLTIITHAVKLSKADAGGTIYEYDGDAGVFEPRANYGLSEEAIETLRESQIRLGETTIGVCAERRAPVQIADVELAHDNRLRDFLLSRGIRAVLAVPLLREERIVGAIAIRKKTKGEFPESVMKLLQTFAAQSVLAIENARLFEEIETKSRELEIASQHKSQFLANMSHELRTPLNAIIGVTEMLQEDARDLKREDELEPLERVLRAARHLLALINDILDLSKIEAGKMDLYVESLRLLR